MKSFADIHFFENFTFPLMDETSILYIYIYIYTHTPTPTYIYICIYKWVKLATVVEVDQKAPFSKATTLKCWGMSATLFPGLLHFTFDTYLILLSAKQGWYQVPFLKSLLRRDLGLNPENHNISTKKIYWNELKEHFIDKHFLWVVVSFVKFSWSSVAQSAWSVEYDDWISLCKQMTAA